MEILEGKTIRIERERFVAESDSRTREVIGYVPAVSGEFVVQGKPLKVTVCPTDASKRQKVIFEGDAFPTINMRGGVRRQLGKLPQRRRVINFSAEPTRIVRQEAGNDTLLFSYVSMRAGRAGD